MPDFFASIIEMILSRFASSSVVMADEFAPPPMWTTNCQAQAASVTLTNEAQNGADAAAPIGLEGDGTFFTSCPLWACCQPLKETCKNNTRGFTGQTSGRAAVSRAGSDAQSAAHASP